MNFTPKPAPLILALIACLFVIAGLAGYIILSRQPATTFDDDCLFYDLNKDGVVNVVDIMKAASHWHCEEPQPTVVPTPTGEVMGEKGVVIQRPEYVRQYELDQLNIQWAYTHWVNENLFGMGFDYVPLIQCKYWESSFKGNVGPVAADHPGSDWLLCNEPDLVGGDNLLPQEALTITHEIVLEIMTADPTARLVVGGTSHLHPEWLPEFVSLYEQEYGELPFDGYHFHIYPVMMGCYCYDPESCFAVTVDYVNGMKASLPGGEWWLSEFGVNKPWAADYISLIVPWLQGSVDRFSIFATHTYAPPWVEWDHGALIGVTPLGWVYAPY
jgi:hypothetical protein